MDIERYKTSRQPTREHEPCKLQGCKRLL